MNYPTYRNHGKHIEAVKVYFDPKVISYTEILNNYWYNIDPTDSGGQFCDRGNSYKAAIFANNDQLTTARISKEYISKNKPFNSPITVPILKSKKFWVAEEYHQDYYKKNPIRYNYYRKGCRRDAVLRRLWK
jgi:methionine-S-sulfoxide reductase